MFGFLNAWWAKLFSAKRRGNVKIGIYGPPNSGKTTLANRICKDWMGEEMGAASPIAHETRAVQEKERVSIKSEDGRELEFTLVDTPGIATRIDFEDFVRAGLPVKVAKKRAREATKGVIDSIKWLEGMDAVLVVLDATSDPYSQVNITLIGNLQARDIPVLLVANKMDLRKAKVDRVADAFPQYSVVGVSAKTGKSIEDLYSGIFKVVD